jgi:hypothetical protein
MPEQAGFVFGPFRLDVRDERLWQGQDVLPLRHKTLRVLHALVARAGHLLTKEALFAAVDVIPGGPPDLDTVEDLLPGLQVEGLATEEDQGPHGPRHVTPQYTAAFNANVQRTVAPAGQTSHVREQPGTLCRVSVPGEVPTPGRSRR